MHIFICWSGDNSKKIAFALKRALEESFEGLDDFTIFISEEDIPSGTNWFENIKTNLNNADCAIICCTPDNIVAPWINFESGASMMTFEGKQVVPYLIGFSAIDKKSPLSHLHCICHSSSGFKKLVKDINDIGQDSNMTKRQLESMAEHCFASYLNSNDIKKIVKSYGTREYITLQSIYPLEPTMISKKSVYISSPMASILEEYESFRNDIIRIENALKKECKVKSVYYPGKGIDKTELFDGKQKALRDNFLKLKECEYLFVVYPHAVPTSVLVEIGYAIALSKKILLFVKEDVELPYMLQEADISINNIHIFQYNNVDDILHQIKSNGSSFLI